MHSHSNIHTNINNNNNKYLDLKGHTISIVLYLINIRLNKLHHEEHFIIVP